MFFSFFNLLFCSLNVSHEFDMYNFQLEPELLSTGNLYSAGAGSITFEPGTFGFTVHIPSAFFKGTAPVLAGFQVCISTSGDIDILVSNL